MRLTLLKSYYIVAIRGMLMAIRQADTVLVKLSVGIGLYGSKYAMVINYYT